MKTVKVSKYLEGIDSIYVEQPKYETGHDGSDGYCDCIGMCRGALKRAGVTDIKNMRGTNQAARKTIVDLQELKSDAPLCLGDVVLKVRDKDDPDMPLPDNYRKGGADYDPTWGETNFTHIGTVTGTNPIEITHMTSPTAKKDKSIKGWTYFGELPYVEYEVSPEPQPEPEPEPEPETQYATVVSENGKPVKMRAKPTETCDLWWKVPNGSEVIVEKWDSDTDKKGQKWSKINWAGQGGYMMSVFLRPADGGGLYTVTIPHLTLYQADALLERYPGSHKESERG